MIYNRAIKNYFGKRSNPTYGLTPFSLGRSAINFLILKLNIKVVYLPALICPIVVDLFLKKDIKVFFYENLDENLKTNQAAIVSSIKKKHYEDCFFFWHDYLGIIGDIPTNVKAILETKQIKTIVDASHTLPIIRYDADYVVYGFRKIIKSPFGAFVLSNKNLNIKENTDYPGYSVRKKCYEVLFNFKLAILLLLKKINSNKLLFFEKILSNIDKRFNPDLVDSFFEDSKIYPKILALYKKVDLDFISKKRLENFHIYNNNFKGFDFISNSPPLGYPLKVKDSSVLRTMLWAKGIHTFIFWKELHNLCPENLKNKFENIANSYLILPVNQDLSFEEIQEVIENINAQKNLLSN